MNSADKNVIFFDGYCGVCDAVVSMLIPWATSAPFLFAPLQGTTYAEIAARHPELKGVDSVVWVKGLGSEREEIAVRGDAALAILKRMGGLWIIPRTLLALLPRSLRNIGYDLFAKHRTRLAGRRDSCRLPTMAERKLFLP